MCDCIQKVNEKLKEFNTELDLLFYIDGSPNRVCLSTSKIIAHERGRAKTMGPTYCPFCGVKYDQPPASEGGE
jgi:hypothetical protein